MGHFKFKILYSLLLVLGITGRLIGQDAGSVQRVKSIDPFIRADEVHIQQDSEDNLWITTPVKVLKYNSVRALDYNKFRGVPRDIGDEFIATYTDSEDQTWLAGNQGLAIYNPEKDSFEFISDVTGRIYALREDSGKQLWIAAENGIFKLKVDSSKADYGISRFLSENTLAADVTLFENSVIFAGPNGILTIDRRSGKFNKIDMGYYQNLHITSVLPMDDLILFGTKDQGLYKTDRDFMNIQKVYSLPYIVAQKEITALQEFNDEIIISTNGAGVIRLNKKLEMIQGPDKIYPQNIYSVLLNDQNLLWVVAKEGLFIQNYSGFAVEKLKNDPLRYSSLANDFVTTGEVDSQGNLWFGTGKGLSIWNPETNRWRHIENLNYNRRMNAPDNITDLAAIDEHMWVATAKDGVYKININTLLRAHYSVDALYKTKIQSANTLFIDAGGNVWIGGEEGYLTVIRPDNEIKDYPVKEVQAIAELGPKQLIVATRTRVHSLNPITGRISDLEALNAGKDLLYYSVKDLKITHGGRGLFATEGAGLLIYDFEDDTLQRLGAEEGLPSSNVTGIEWLSDEKIWLATDKGMAYYNGVENEIKVFSELNGLSTNELTTDFMKLDNGSFVLGSSKGVNIFKPKVMLAQQEFKPRLQFRNFVSPDENGKTDEVQLAGINDLEIEEGSGFYINFQGISHLDPEGILYSWKMEGLEDDWSRPTTLNKASYSNLPPGNFVFKVRSRLRDSGWTEPKRLSINVQAAPATISTVYVFMGISVLAMVAIFIFVFSRRSKNADQLAKVELRNRLQKEFRKPVESAVQSLSKISASADSESVEELQRFAARFDDLFHQILNFNYQESVYEISKINLNRHFPQVVKDIEPVYKSKNLEMIVNDQWGDAEFYYNMEMLDKIFFSLISGSAGYSFKGGKIIINLIETSVGDLKLQITDNGRGMPTHDIKVLEKNKYPNQKMKLRDRSGLRYILKAKDLISKSGGSFSYETEKNEGSTFTAILKNRREDYRKVPERAAAIFKAEKSKNQPATSVPSELKNLSEIKILIIEGDSNTRHLLVNNIGKYCQIYQAATAEEGLEKAGMIFPDIIISATVLADMNFFQLTKMLKRNIGLNHINLILIADAGQKFAGEQLDEMTEIIRKPLEINLLLSKLTKILIWQQEIRNSYIQSHIDNSKVEFRNGSDERFISNLTDIVIGNINNENFSVHDLSGKIGISSNALFMKLKSLVNLSPQDFMEFTRLNYAREMLESGEYNPMEVAYKSGFSSPKLFYSSFKKFYGYNLSDSIEKPL
ncbi:hybrid sensor histidine kinase/response regulator transcription factor [Christiangramia crocea]|uniref:Helix-turn-helix domain-containing protein n=1 Tax=Christiangramia crocea TaxID=2904124 RepID=A0A9X2A7H9_9FLAO|nr:triple tyrosine motif-containing protein [Gramella crocea]MCG9971896.1 helix-turn-helix domain-containing protein [Gramella crocea]